MNNFHRALVCEWLGTMFLLATVVGSGIMAENLAAGNMAIALLGNTIPTGAILVVLITIFGPISGAHFNPAVTIAFLLRGEILPWRAVAYVVVQVVGGICGAVLAHLMFELPLSRNRRSCEPVWHNGYRSLRRPLVCWQRFLAHCGGGQRPCR